MNSIQKTGEISGASYFKRDCCSEGDTGTAPLGWLLMVEIAQCCWGLVLHLLSWFRKKHCSYCIAVSYQH